LVTLASIKAYAPNAKYDQLLLTLLLEFLRCLEGAASKHERSQPNSKCPPPKVEASEHDMTEIYKEIHTMLKEKKDKGKRQGRWFRYMNDVHSVCQASWDSSVETKHFGLWVQAVMQILLDMPGFRDSSLLDGGAVIDDPQEILVTTYEHNKGTPCTTVEAKLKNAVLIEWEPWRPFFNTAVAVVTKDGYGEQ
jgi:hypothetical protein